MNQLLSVCRIRVGVLKGETRSEFVFASAFKHTKKCHNSLVQDLTGSFAKQLLGYRSPIFGMLLPIFGKLSCEKQFLNSNCNQMLGCKLHVVCDRHTCLKLPHIVDITAV